MNITTIFLLFIKVNLLTTSGPASVGLLYKEAVGSLMTESEFVEAVGFSSAGGIPGALAALLGSLLPPTLLMLGVVYILQWLRGEAWVTNFVHGLSPAVAVLMVLVAWQVFRGEGGSTSPVTLVIGGLSLLALYLQAPAPLVLLGAGLLGVVFYR